MAVPFDATSLDSEYRGYIPSLHKTATTKGVFVGNISVVLPDNVHGPVVGPARVFQDDNEIKHVRRIIINIAPDDVITVDMEIFPMF